jgi:hypothetical protein
MATKSLKKRIDELVNVLGKALTPHLTADIRGELVELGGLVKALENGQAAAEQEARITDLETQLGNLQVALETANVEIETFRAERKKREEKEREIDPTQFKILDLLPNEHGGGRWLKINEIARALEIPVDEAEVYILGMEKLRLAFFHTHEPGGGGWLRTAEGNKVVVARRWAGEEKETPKAYKHPDLPERQHAVLVALGSDLDGLTEETIAEKAGLELPRTIRALRLLSKAGMATDGGSDAVVFGDGALWWILERGEEYLEERDLL